jgi:adenosylcobyric acid synthase
MKHNTHGGDAAAVAQKLGLKTIPPVALDFSVNVNPLGPPPSLAPVLQAAMSRLSEYPDPTASGAASSLATAHGVDPETVVVGNGTTELFGTILQAMKVKEAGWISPCYTGYAEACTASGVKAGSISIAKAETNFAVSLDALKDTSSELVFLATPNNPTGTTLDRSTILNAASDHPTLTIVVDESFIDFTENADEQTLIGHDLPENLIVAKSLTKFFAIPGLRLGMLYACASTAERIRQCQLPWSVNTLAQAASDHLYSDDTYIAESRKTTISYRDALSSRLENISGFETYPSAANFVLAKLPDSLNSDQLQSELLARGILIRNCSNIEGLGTSFCRIAARPLEDTDVLIAELQSIMSGSPKPVAPKKTPAVMVVGTTSDAGKSLVAAALCRLLKRRGTDVAPFKAQNMSLNSFVTKEGGEMGRAQVVQARASGIEPHTDMNPVLLKPMGDAGSQVIVDGKAIGNFPAEEYYEMKERMRASAHAAYDRLADRHDFIVMEGAGSPAEINLLAEDFVNMSMAEYADASVVLVADIDRGGVFASIYGTLALMPTKHRQMIRGIIINKFRGNQDLLDPGILQIEELTGVPVLGVMPYLRDIQIEDEDSLALDNRQEKSDAVLNIAVIRLPRISNFTDFLAFEHLAGVSVTYPATPEAANSPDLIIIPGTKHTRSDLQFLIESGWNDFIASATSAGTPVLGICGGYQMLGIEINDPDGVEGESGSTPGLGLLPVTTVLAPEKELARVEGVTNPSLPFAEAGTVFSGYEIHAGRTKPTGSSEAPLSITKRLSESVLEPDGAVTEDALVFGTYVHGIFDTYSLRDQLLNWLCERKGTQPLLWQTDQDEDPIDSLADALETHVALESLLADAS